MNKEFLVYKGEPFTRFGKDEKGYFLYGDGESSVEEGFEKHVEKYVTYRNYNTGVIEYGETISYRKYLPLNEISQIYRVEDRVLYKGHEYTIATSSDENFDQPFSYVRIYTEDKVFLEVNGLMEGAEIFPEKYGRMIYHSAKIPASEVAIIRRRQNIPIEGKQMKPIIFTIASQRVLTIGNLWLTTA